jgi:hypothetical protein
VFLWLAARGVVADLYVFGGAAMAVAYDARRATRDVNALFMPHGIVLDEAQAVAKEFGLPGWWLNEQASAYVAPGGDPDAKLVFHEQGACRDAIQGRGQGAAAGPAG